jgi:hypothetical protein
MRRQLRDSAPGVESRMPHRIQPIQIPAIPLHSRWFPNQVSSLWQCNVICPRQTTLKNFLPSSNAKSDDYGWAAPGPP